MNSGKSLPVGSWLSILSLSPETTEQDVQDLLAKSGIDLPLENIVVVQTHQNFTRAVISIERRHVADLFLRATQLDPRYVSWQGKGR